MKPVWIYMAVVGVLVGAIQVRELLAVVYIPGKAFVNATVEVVDANIDRAIAPLRGLGSDE